MGSIIDDNSKFLPSKDPPAADVPQSAWEGYLKNLGVWIGKRALSNSRGKVLIDIPNRVIAEQYRTSAKESFVLWRTAVRTGENIDEAEEEWSRSELADFGALAADGSFSVGAQVFFGEPITVDQCLFEDNIRVRTTHAFDWEGCLSGVVASRERYVTDVLGNSLDEASLGLGVVEPAAWRNPRILFDYMLGLWEGKGVSINPRTGDICQLTSRLKHAQAADGRVSESSVLRIGDSGPTRVFEASGKMDGNFIIFPESNVQLFLLPGGVFASAPIRIRKGRPFTIETAFLMKPDCRKRVLRLYDRECQWINTVFINERRVG